MSAVQVVAPLVLVKDQSGLIGYHYRGQVIPWLSAADLARLQADGMVVPVAAPLVLLKHQEVVARPSVQAEEVVPVVARPAKNHAKELWVDYAVSKGWDRTTAEDAKKADLIAALTDDDPTDGEDDVDDEPETPELVAPPKAGLLEDWQKYARAKGLSDDDIAGLDKQGLIELLT